jgi:hypothetical protein
MRNRPRRTIALLAAYLIALQALLLPLSVATGAPLASEICSTSADGSHSPVSHDTGCPCAAACGMQCCAQALTGPASVGMALAPARSSVIAFVPAIEAVFRPAAKGPQNPRAPPSA